MGISCSFGFYDVRIPKDRYELVKKAALEHDPKLKPESLVDIESIFQEFGYEISEDISGRYYTVDGYMGDNLGSNEDLWRLMAPAVESGIIYLTVENDEQYKWRFICGQMVEFIGRIVYEDEGEFYLKRIRAR